MSDKKQKKQDLYNFDLTDIIIFLVRNFKKLVILGAIGAVVAFIATMPMITKPLYMSKAQFYPGTTNSISSQLFYSIKDKSRDPLAFAELETIEQYLQLLNSDELKGRIIKKYDLYNHYNINRESRGAGQAMDHMYNDLIRIKRTNFNAIEVTVRDQNPDKAAEIANGIMYAVDGLKKEVQKRIAKQVFDVVEKAYNDKIQLIDSLQQRLKVLGAEGVFDPVSQSKGLAEVVGKGQNNQFTESEKRKLASMGPEAMVLIEMLTTESENLVFLRTKYDQAKIDLEADISNLFIIDYAGSSWDKVYPKRFLTMVVASILAAFAGIVFILIIEQYHRIKHLLAKSEE